MTRRLSTLLLTVLLALSLGGCGGTKAAPTWQEQYDLGVRYLSEGNYEEAIIAFTAAIDIDPKRPEAYISLAQVYTAQGDTDNAVRILNQALSAIGENDAISAALEELTVPDDPVAAWWENIQNEFPTPPIPLGTVASTRADQQTGRYYENDANGNTVRSTETRDRGDGKLVKQVYQFYPNSSGEMKYRTVITYDADSGECLGYSMHTYDDTGRRLEDLSYQNDGYIVRKTSSYAGSTVEVSFDFVRYDGQEGHWSHTHTMSDPRNETFVSGSGWGDAIQYVQIREEYYQNHKTLYEAKFDPAGNLLEERSD